MPYQEGWIEQGFKNGNQTFSDAVYALQNLGYLREDAEDMVQEWLAESRGVE